MAAWIMQRYCRNARILKTRKVQVRNILHAARPQNAIRANKLIKQRPILLSLSLTIRYASFCFQVYVRPANPIAFINIARWKVLLLPKREQAAALITK